MKSQNRLILDFKQLKDRNKDTNTSVSKEEYEDLVLNAQEQIKNNENSDLTVEELEQVIVFYQEEMKNAKY